MIPVLQDAYDEDITVELYALGAFSGVKSGYILFRYQYTCEGESCALIPTEENPCHFDMKGDIIFGS